MQLGLKFTIWKRDSFTDLHGFKNYKLIQRLYIGWLLYRIFFKLIWLIYTVIRYLVHFLPNHTVMYLVNNNLYDWNISVSREWLKINFKIQEQQNNIERILRKCWLFCQLQEVINWKKTWVYFNIYIKEIKNKF